MCAISLSTTGSPQSGRKYSGRHPEGLSPSTTAHSRLPIYSNLSCSGIHQESSGSCRPRSRSWRSDCWAAECGRVAHPNSGCNAGWASPPGITGGTPPTGCRGTFDLTTDSRRRWIPSTCACFEPCPEGDCTACGESTPNSPFRSWPEELGSAASRRGVEWDCGGRADSGEGSSPTRIPRSWALPFRCRGSYSTQAGTTRNRRRRSGGCSNPRSCITFRTSVPRSSSPKLRRRPRDVREPSKDVGAPTCSVRRWRSSSPHLRFDSTLGIGGSYVPSDGAGRRTGSRQLRTSMSPCAGSSAEFVV